MAETARHDKAQQGERTRRRRQRQRREPAAWGTCQHTLLARLQMCQWEAQLVRGLLWLKTTMVP